MDRDEILKRAAPCSLLCHTCTACRNGVDFCGECGDFPCQKTKGLFEPEVYKQWLNGNQEIRDKGIEAFWESHSERPHYIPYKK